MLIDQGTNVPYLSLISIPSDPNLLEFLNKSVLSPLPLPLTKSSARTFAVAPEVNPVIVSPTVNLPNEVSSKIRECVNSKW